MIKDTASAFLTVAVSNVKGSVKDIKTLVSTLDGVLDNVFLSLHDGEERANLSIRVFTPDFKQALAFIEGEGEVRTVSCINFHQKVMKFKKSDDF